MSNEFENKQTHYSSSFSPEEKEATADQIAAKKERITLSEAKKLLTQVEKLTFLYQHAISHEEKLNYVSKLNLLISEIDKVFNFSHDRGTNQIRKSMGTIRLTLFQQERKRIQQRFAHYQFTFSEHKAKKPWRVGQQFDSILRGPYKPFYDPFVSNYADSPFTPYISEHSKQEFVQPNLADTLPAAGIETASKPLLLPPSSAEDLSAAAENTIDIIENNRTKKYHQNINDPNLLHRYQIIRLIQELRQLKINYVQAEEIRDKTLALKQIFSFFKNKVYSRNFTRSTETIALRKTLNEMLMDINTIPNDIYEDFPLDEAEHEHLNQSERLDFEQATEQELEQEETELKVGERLGSYYDDEDSVFINSLGGYSSNKEAQHDQPNTLIDDENFAYTKESSMAVDELSTLTEPHSHFLDDEKHAYSEKPASLDRYPSIPQRESHFDMDNSLNEEETAQDFPSAPIIENTHNIELELSDDDKLYAYDEDDSDVELELEQAEQTEQQALKDDDKLYAYDEDDSDVELELEQAEQTEQQAHENDDKLYAYDEDDSDAELELEQNEQTEQQALKDDDELYAYDEKDLDVELAQPEPSSVNIEDPHFYEQQYLQQEKSEQNDIANEHEDLAQSIDETSITNEEDEMLNEYSAVDGFSNTEAIHPVDEAKYLDIIEHSKEDIFTFSDQDIFNLMVSLSQDFGQSIYTDSFQAEEIFNAGQYAVKIKYEDQHKEIPADVLLVLDGMADLLKIHAEL